MFDLKRMKNVIPYLIRSPLGQNMISVSSMVDRINELKEEIKELQLKINEITDQRAHEYLNKKENE